MKVSDAAKMLGKSEQFVRVGLQQKVFPFGVAVKVRNRWNYHISDHLFKQYIGEDEIDE